MNEHWSTETINKPTIRFICRFGDLTVLTYLFHLAVLWYMKKTVYQPPPPPSVIELIVAMAEVVFVGSLDLMEAYYCVSISSSRGVHWLFITCSCSTSLSLNKDCTEGGCLYSSQCRCLRRYWSSLWAPPPPNHCPALQPVTLTCQIHSVHEITPMNNGFCPLIIKN